MFHKLWCKVHCFTGNCLLNWREHLRQTQISQIFSVNLFEFADKQTDTSRTYSGWLYWLNYSICIFSVCVFIHCCCWLKKRQWFYPLILSRLLFPVQLTRDEAPWIAWNSCHRGERLHKITIVFLWKRGPLVVGRQNGTGREGQGPGEGNERKGWLDANRIVMFVVYEKKPKRATAKQK